jgi:hypothetical protein
MATGRRVALLVPAGEVSFFQATLPAGNEARLLQLAPFALEDQLSQDVDALHFAVGARDPASGTVPVAVMERARLEHYLARAAQLQIIPHAVFAESDLAPLLPGHVTMLVSADQLLLRDDAARPLVLPAADPLLALEMLPGTGSNLAQANLTVFVGPGDWQKHAHLIEPLRERVGSFKVQLNNGGVMAQLAQGLAHGAPLNLLQGALKPRSSSNTSWQAALGRGPPRRCWCAHGRFAVALRHLRRTSTELDAPSRSFTNPSSRPAHWRRSAARAREATGGSGGRRRRAGRVHDAAGRGGRGQAERAGRAARIPDLQAGRAAAEAHRAGCQRARPVQPGAARERLQGRAEVRQRQGRGL